jgi:hypothetical protein
VGPLVDALSLPGSMSGFFSSPRDEILDALASALRCDPDTTVPVLESRGRSGDDELRAALFDVCEKVMRDGRRAQQPASETAAVAVVDAAFRRLDGDWGDQVAVDAATLIASTSRYDPVLMVPRIDQLFGALVMQAGRLPVDAPRLAVPTARPPLLAALEESGRRSAHAAVVRELRKALGELVPHEPSAVARNVMSIIGAPEVDAEEAKDLRDEAVRLLGDLGERAELLPDVLPALWSALLHGDQRVRARAIEAWQKIAACGHRLPSELAELLPALLRDRYVIVHTATIRAIRSGLPVPNEQLSDVVGLLLAWAHHYATEDAHLLDDLLNALWSLGDRLPDGAAVALREQCLQLAEHLRSYDKQRFVEWRSLGSEALPSLAARLLEVAADQRDRMNQRDDGVLRRLRGLDGPRLTGLGEEIRAAARAHLPHDHWEAERFIEILQRAGLWTLARELAQEIRDTIPDNEEHAVARTGVQALVELARAEEALREGKTSEARSAFEDSQRAVAEQQSRIDALPSPWETK